MCVSVKVPQKNRTNRRQRDRFSIRIGQEVPPSAVCKLEKQRQVLVRRLKNQDRWYLRAGDDECLDSSKEQICPSCACLFYSGHYRSADTHLYCEGDILYLVYRFKCYSLPETPSQTNPEIMFFSSSLSSFSPVKLTYKINHHMFKNMIIWLLYYYHIVSINNIVRVDFIFKMLSSEKRAEGNRPRY